MAERLRIRRSGLEWRTVEDEVVALDLPAETYLGVNRSGSLLWQQLIEGATPEELVQLLAGEFAMDTADAQRDVSDFIAALRQLDLLETEPA